MTIVPNSPKTKKGAPRASRAQSSRQIGAGEFKARCLAIIDEVHDAGYELVITKRGKPKAKLVPFISPEDTKRFLGRLEGVMKINGDLDDLIKPVFPLEDWDMLK